MAKWKFQQIEPQPARGTFLDDMWDSSLWVAEEKYDGDRRIAQFCDGIVRFTGRRKSVKDGLFVEKTDNIPHLSGNKIRKPPSSLDGTVLDGEMVINVANMPGLLVDEGRSKFVTSIMGSAPNEAISKQLAKGWLEYVVFDCLFYQGKDWRKEPLAERRYRAASAIEKWGNKYVHLADRKMTFKRQFYNEITGRGGEGIILKHLGAPYGDRTAWVKVKKSATADVVIMGFKDAKETSVKKGDVRATQTKYAKAGLIGAIICGQYDSSGKLVEVASISGMDDAVRAELTTGGLRAYRGLVIEIEHNGTEPTGRFRHPRFKRFRYDKQAMDCVMRPDES